MLLDPPRGRQGTDQVVIVHGTGTDFAAGGCAARFPDGRADVPVVRVEAPDRLRLVLAIPDDAETGAAPLELDTPSGSFVPEFTILAAAGAAAVALVPDTVVAPYAGDLAIDGTATRFEAGVTRVSFAEDSGIAVTGLEVESETRARVRVEVPATAAEGDYAVAVSTRTEVLGTVLHVLSGVGPSLAVEPDSGLQGATVPVAVATRNFPLGEAPVLEFPWNDGLTVVAGSTEVRSTADDPDGLLAAVLEIADDAPIGATTARVRAGDREVSGAAFTVLRAGDTPSCSFHPSTVHAGETRAEVQAVGRYTSFRTDVTYAESARPDVRIDALFVPGPATALLAVAVDEHAPVGDADVTFVTGAERVACALSVVPPPPASLSVEPDVLEHPADADRDVEVTLHVAGVDLTAGDVALATERGSGIAVRSFEVLDAATAAATLRLSRDAPFGPSRVDLAADGTVALSADVLVTRAAGDAPRIVPAYVMIDGAARNLVFESSAPSFFEGGEPWVSRVRSHVPGLGIDAGPVGEEEIPVTAVAGLAVPSGHATVGAHGAAGPEAGRKGRHVAVRITAVGAGGPVGEASPSAFPVGLSRTVMVSASADLFVDGETAATAPRDSGLSIRGLLVVDPSRAFVVIDPDMTALLGGHALVLRTRGEAVPAVVELTAPAELPSFTSGDSVTPGTTADVALTGAYTRWAATTTAEVPGDDPDVTTAGLVVADETHAALSVTASPSPMCRGGHVVLLRTGLNAAAGLVWIDAPPRRLGLAPAWLHAGADEQIALSGTEVDPAAAAVAGISGIESLSVVERGAGRVLLAARPARTGAASAVLSIDPDGSGSPVQVMLPVLASPPHAEPATVALPRAAAPRAVSVALRGLDVESGLAVRTSGDDLYAGQPVAAGAEEAAVDTVLGLGASAASPHWLVFLSETDAAPLRVLPGGDPPRAMPDSAVPEPVTVAPGLSVARALSATSDGLAIVRAACADPSATTPSLVARDGATLLLGLPAGDAALPPAPLGDLTGAAGYLVVDATAPTTCVLRQTPWVPLERGTHDLEPNDDSADAEAIPLAEDAGGDVVVAHHHLAVLAAGWDVDRYVVDLPRAAEIAAFAGPSDDFAARAELALEVTGPDGSRTEADAWAARAGGVASVVAPEPGRYEIAVRAVSGTDGPYVLSLRGPAILDEVDLWSGGTRFVELAVVPGHAIDGYRLVHRSASGTVAGEVALRGIRIPDDGRVVVAAAATFPDVDAVWSGLDEVGAAAALALVDDAGRDADVLGFDGGPGEGRPASSPSPDESPASLGRCAGLDSDDNATDFWRLRAPSPGEPNVCEYR